MSEGNGDTARGLLLASIQRLDQTTRDLWGEVKLLRQDSAEDRRQASLQSAALGNLPCEQHRKQLVDLRDSQNRVEQTIRDRLSWKALVGKLSAALIPLLLAGMLLADRIKAWIGVQP